MPAQSGVPAVQQGVPARTADGSCIVYQPVFSDKFTFDNAEDFLIIRQHNSRVWKVNRISTNEVLITIDADKSPGSEVHIGTADGRPLAVLRKAPLAISWNISLMDVRGKPHDLAQAKGRMMEEGLGVRLTGESSSRFHVGTNDHSMKTFAIYRTPPPAEATPLKLPPGVRQASSAIASTGSAAAGVLRGVPVVGGIGNFLKRTSVDSSSGSKPAAGGGDVGNSSMNSRSTAGEAAQGSGDSIISTSSGGSIVRLSNLPRVPKLASVLTSAYGCSFIRDGENIDKEMQMRNHIVAVLRVLPGMDVVLALCLATIYDMVAREKRPPPSHHEGNWYQQLSEWQTSYKACLLQKQSIEMQAHYEHFYGNAGSDTHHHQQRDQAAQLPAHDEAEGEAEEGAPPAKPRSSKKPPPVRRARSVEDFSKLKKQFSTIVEVDELFDAAILAAGAS